MKFIFVKGRSFQKIGHLVKTNCYRIRKRNALIATLFLCCHTVGLACYTLFLMRLSRYKLMVFYLGNTSIALVRLGDPSFRKFESGR